MKTKRTWLNEIRRKSGKNQQTVANECGMSRQMYSFIESGDRGVCVKTAKKIAAALGFAWQRFYEDQEEGQKG